MNKNRGRESALHVRVTKEMKRAVEDYAVSRDLDESDVVRSAVNQFLNSGKDQPGKESAPEVAGNALKAATKKRG